MDRYVFLGYPSFLERATKELGLDFSPASQGKPLLPLASLANLCAQASLAGPEHVAAILREAEAFHRQLLIAAKAAELMLAEVGRACDSDPSIPKPKPSAIVEPVRSQPARPSSRPSISRS